MIGFDALGELGRLGNQMFQYAALRGIAAHRGFEFCIPPRDRHELADCFELRHLRHVALLGSAAPTVSEHDYHFDEALFHGCPDGVSLFGHLQSPRYFQHIEGSLREDFTFHDALRERAVAARAAWRWPEVVALHVRRTDYLVDPNHPALPLDYYRRALAALPDAPVAVFSDDLPWCRKQALFADRGRFRFAATGSDHADLCLMSLCQHFVIANSSYSWWGAWLSRSPGRRVVAPLQWFGAEFAHLVTADVFPAGWQRV